MKRVYLKQSVYYIQNSEDNLISGKAKLIQCVCSYFVCAANLLKTFKLKPLPKMQTAINMNRFLLSLYIICLVHAQVPQNCVKSMVVNDIDTGGSHLAKIFDISATEHQHQQQQQQQQHHIRHGHIQNHHHHHQHHHNSNQQQAESNHNVDAGNYNDVEIGHMQPNMVNFVINKQLANFCTSLCNYYPLWVHW